MYPPVSTLKLTALTYFSQCTYLGMLVLGNIYDLELIWLLSDETRGTACMQSCEARNRGQKDGQADSNETLYHWQYHLLNSYGGLR